MPAASTEAGGDGMTKIRKALLWFGLLSKRLYKKVTFLAILVLIPLLVLGYSAAAREDSGVLTVALAQEGEDALVSQIMGELQSDSQLLRYVICRKPSDAEAMLRAGKADAAWIFPADMQQRIRSFAARPTNDNALIKVLEREENVALMLAREKLSGALYPYCAEALYLRYIRENVPEMAQVSDETLLSHYREADVADELFTFAHADASAAMGNVQDIHYLMAPVRGLLAVVILLSGMATAMYYFRDAQIGTFAWVPENRRPAAELGCQLVSVTHASLASLIALTAIGMAGTVGRELLVLVLYSLCTAAFCMAVRRLCGSARLLAMVLPLLIVVTLLVCPVFFDLGALRQAQYLFPPTYYINAVHNDNYLLYMLLYTLVMWAVYLLAGKLLKRN